MAFTEDTFTLRGGPCDGQKVTLPVRWDGYGHRPPEFVQALPREPLPDVINLEAIPTTEKTTVVTYYRHIFQQGERRWFEFRPEPQENP